MSLDSWQNYDSLQEVLKRFSSINLKLQFKLNIGDFVNGTLTDYVFDDGNIFITLADASINEMNFPNFSINGFDIYQWRLNEDLSQLEERLDELTATNTNYCATQRTSNKLLIDKSAFNSKHKPDELTFSFNEIDLDQDDNYVAIDLGCLQLPASNKIELVKLNLIYSSCELNEYLDKCNETVTQLLKEELVGFAIFPLANEVHYNSNITNNSTNSAVINKLNRATFLQNFVPDSLYLCFSTADRNYAFYFAYDNNDSMLNLATKENNRKTIQIIRPLLESNQTQKVVCGCSLISGILWNKFDIKLTNVCDLQLVDKQIQRINYYCNSQRYRTESAGASIGKHKASSATTPAIELHSCFQLIKCYLDIELTPPEAVQNWTQFTTKVANTIRANLIFHRELSIRMNYELMHYLFAFSDRCLTSLRSASDSQFKLLKDNKSIDQIYNELMEQPLFEYEKSFCFFNLVERFPLKYYDPAFFVDDL